jgi:choline dehydrogenase-like flavoprotein
VARNFDRREVLTRAASLAASAAAAALAFGAPGARRRPVLDWRLQEIDRRTLARASRVYAPALVGAGLARTKRETRLGDENGAGWERVSSDWHQMGGTRMADHPARGVVDANCRVFRIDNLFVAGASVFPTGGAINPTLTPVALALRLGDQLRQIGT